MGIVVLGVCGVKKRKEKAFWELWWGELETTDLGLGVHSSMYPHFYGFRSTGVGVLLTYRGHELAPV
jgi:hypothetical protein